MGRVATFGNMDPEKTWNEMAFCPHRPSPITGFHGSQDRVHLKPGRRPRQRLRRRGDGRRDEATHERRRYRDGDRMAAGWEEHRLLRRGRAPRLRRAGESRRPHEEGRRIPGFGELDRWRPRDSQAVVSGWPRARLRVERP